MPETPVEPSLRANCLCLLSARSKGTRHSFINVWGKHLWQKLLVWGCDTAGRPWVPSSTQFEKSSHTCKAGESGGSVTRYQGRGEFWLETMSQKKSQLTLHPTVHLYNLPWIYSQIVRVFPPMEFSSSNSVHCDPGFNPQQWKKWILH